MNATRNENITRALTIDGWLLPSEAAALYDLASAADSPIIEIGSWNGRSTAALALGSMAGRNQPIYAIDSFEGVLETSAKTDLGNDPNDNSPSPTRLRANLDSVGVNGLAHIVPKKSSEALSDIPEECGLLFIDGSHDYESVRRDLDLFLPRVKVGGYVVLHDVNTDWPGVVQAVNEVIRADPLHYRVMDQVDNALVVRKVNTTSRSINLACPGSSFSYGAVCGIMQCTLGVHRISLDNNGNGFDDFNALWARALNRAESGEITHFAMIHSDIMPAPGWLDILVDECEEMQADLVSVPSPIKDDRGVMSCGWGTMEDRWGAFRRLTVRECVQMPPTWGREGSLYPDHVLLHNTGCWIADLRSPVFYHTDEHGDLRAWFDFPTKIGRGSDGKWANRRESEDWFFSRQLHTLGAKTFLSRKVRLGHEGKQVFKNDLAWGLYERGDQDTAALWSPKKVEA